MWYFIGGAITGAAVGLVTATLLINAKKLDQELNEAMRKWSDELEI